jgi:hypothetical protein
MDEGKEKMMVDDTATPLRVAAESHPNETDGLATPVVGDVRRDNGKAYIYLNVAPRPCERKDSTHRTPDSVYE